MSDYPDHPVLARIAEHYERARWMGVLVDRDMRLVWMSTEAEVVLGAAIRRLIGRHYLEFLVSDEVINISTRRSIMRSGLDFLPMFIHRTPGGKEEVRAVLGSVIGAEGADIVDHVPTSQDPVWMTSFKWSPAEGMEPVVNWAVHFDVHDHDNEFIGVGGVFLASLPTRLVALTARGDEAALERMARLTTPGRRSAAILFADLQASGLLSRRLPSAVYFRLVRTLITAIDGVVVDQAGIVGRHAGDGVTAFFLTDDLGSASLAARAALQAARSIGEAVQGAASGVETDTDGLVTAKDCAINVGLHWGGSLYMGQLNTGGRLEVTALGDAVNECARIQESARDGEILVSKALIENLDGDAAATLGVDPDTLSYVSISQLAHASEKAVRDAGGIAVASL